MPVVPFISFIAVGMVRHNNAVKNGTFIEDKILSRRIKNGVLPSRQSCARFSGPLYWQDFSLPPPGTGGTAVQIGKGMGVHIFFKLSLCINSTFSLLSQIRGKIHTHHIRKGVRVPFPASFASTVPFLCHLRCKELWKPSYQERDGGTF